MDELRKKLIKLCSEYEISSEGVPGSLSFFLDDAEELIEAHTSQAVERARVEEVQEALDLVESGAEYQDIRSDLIDRLASLKIEGSDG